MLLEFSFENFGPFKEYMEFSLKPGKVSQRFADNVIENEYGLKTSKVGVIAGENAGGKTNFIRSIKFIKDVIEGTAVAKAYKRLCYDYDDSNPQGFEIKVIIDNHIYIYKLKLDKIGLLYEELSIKNKSSKRIDLVYFFIREGFEAESGTMKVNFNYEQKFFDEEEITLIKTVLPKLGKRLVLNLFDDLNINLTTGLINWFKTQLMVVCPGYIGFNLYKEYEKADEDFEIAQKESFLEIFKIIDPSIEYLEFEDPEDLFSETLIVRKREDGTLLKNKLQHDSSGINEYFAWSIAIWKVINTNTTLFADEIDRVLNVVLASKILSYVKGQDIKGQFIFSTHNIYHLNTNDFMKEQIFFVHKSKDTLTSELYSLADFDYSYSQPKVYELYLKGLLGAVPNE